MGKQNQDDYQNLTAEEVQESFFIYKKKDKLVLYSKM